MHRSYDQRVDILWRHLPWKALDVFYLSHVFFPVPAHAQNVTIFCREAHDSYSSTTNTPVGKTAYQNASERAKLLDALRHSQARAREAEIAAKKAYEATTERIYTTHSIVILLTEKSICLQILNANQRKRN
jgi:hypothetical protein